MTELFVGTIVLLFTDVEDYTRLCAADEMGTLASLRRHDQILREVIEARGGNVFKTVGDAFHASFASPQEALGAAVDAQRRLFAELWDEGGPALQVRMALHIGTPECRDADYFGLSVNHVARVRDLGHGGQILLTRAFHEVINEIRLENLSFRSLNSWHVKGMPNAVTVYQVVAPELPDVFPPLRSVAEGIGNLPEVLASLFGREEATREIAQLLEQQKLLTLRGAGGCGKTRLAIEVARPLTTDFPGGVWLVRLDAIEDGSLVGRELARVLRLYIPPDQTPEQAMALRLQEQPALIVLDNCEHLRSDCARLAHSLLSVCPDLRVLATSREPLGVPGEFVREVPPLPLPDDANAPAFAAISASPAVQLFVARAEATGNLSLNRRNAAVVADICRALGGIPLALELAARWVGVLSLEEIARELRDLINEPPDDESGIIPARQRTMRAAVDWSFNRLTPADQALFLNLSVFAGGFTLDAVRGVATSDSVGLTGVLRTLKSLVDHSLVFFDPNASPDPRYRLLEPIREVALDKLAGTAEELSIRNRHCDWFLRYAERAEAALHGPAQPEWLERLETDHDNFRAALKWSTNPAQRLQLAVALHRFWLIRSHLGEGRAWIEGALRQALAPEVRVKGVNALGILCYVQRDYADAGRFFREALSLCRGLGNSEGVAKSLNNVGLTEERLGNYSEAHALFEECLQLYRNHQDSPHTASVLSNLGMVAYKLGDFDRACIWFRDSIALHQSSGNASDLGVALHNLGISLFEKGEYDASLAQHCESLHVRQGLKHEQGIVDSVFRIALTYSAVGHHDKAVAAFAFAETALQTSPDLSLSPEDRTGYEAEIARLRGTFDEVTFQRHWKRGQVLSAVEIAAEISST